MEGGRGDLPLNLVLSPLDNTAHLSCLSSSLGMACALAVIKLASETQV